MTLGAASDRQSLPRWATAVEPDHLVASADDGGTITWTMFEHEELSGSITDLVRDGVIITTADLSGDGPLMLYVNRAVEQLTGYSADELIGRSPRMFQGPRTLEVERRRIAAALEAAEPVRAELINYSKGGAEYIIELDITPVLDDSGRAVRFVAIQRDVTDARLTDRWFRSLTEHSAEVVTVSDPDGTVRYVSPSVESMLGWRPEDIVGTKGTALVHPADAARVAAGLMNASRRPGSNAPVEFRFKAVDGSWRWLEAVTTNLLDEPAVRALVVNARDVSSTKALEAERDRLDVDLRDRAMHDQLTGLLNRDEVERQLSEDMNGAATLGDLIAIDVDDLALVNDTFGHHAGDHVLREVADRLRRVTSPGSVLSRVGSDEFLVLLPAATDGTPSFARQLADDLRRAVRAPVHLDGRSVRMTACAGVAPVVAGDADRSLGHVEMALAAAKAQGADRCSAFDPAMETAALDRIEIVLDLRDAVAAGQLRLHYQPSFRTGDGVVGGIEALVRWDHPRRGLLSPGTFIAAAEASRQIFEIGHWVAVEACAARARLGRDHGLCDDVTMWINVSAVELERRSYSTELLAVIRDAGLCPVQMGIEVTESALMADPDAAIAHLDTLSRAGVRIAIDDFGTGYSSIAYITSFPVDLVKFDAMFTQRASQDPKTATVIRTIAALMRDLGAHTCMEGVETDEHLRQVQSLGADLVAGLFLARPVTEAELPWAAGLDDAQPAFVHAPSHPAAQLHGRFGSA